MSLQRFLDDQDRKVLTTFFRLLDADDMQRLVAGVPVYNNVPDSENWWLASEVLSDHRRRTGGKQSDAGGAPL